MLGKKYFWDIFKSECVCQPCLENWPLHPRSTFYTYYKVCKIVIVISCAPCCLIIISNLNFLCREFRNPDVTNMLILECDNFAEFKNTVIQRSTQRPNLNYLYSFLKILFNHVKRPFALYEECVEMISILHIFPTDYKIVNDLLREV